MILYVNSCPREDSRTARIADALLSTFDDEIQEINVVTDERLQPLDNDTLKMRELFISTGNLTHPMFDLAKQFAAADTIVISAPYWDYSFPAALKIYIENIFVKGIVTIYEGDGVPRGLCNAKKLYYVTTAGGPYDSTYSYEHIADIAESSFGIPETELICVDMLDIDGIDAEELVQAKIDELIGN